MTRKEPKSNITIEQCVSQGSSNIRIILSTSAVYTVL